MVDVIVIVGGASQSDTSPGPLIARVKHVDHGLFGLKNHTDSLADGGRPDKVFPLVPKELGDRTGDGDTIRTAGEVWPRYGNHRPVRPGPELTESCQAPNNPGAERPTKQPIVDPLDIDPRRVDSIGGSSRQVISAPISKARRSQTSEHRTHPHDGVVLFVPDLARARETLHRATCAIR